MAGDLSCLSQGTAKGTQRHALLSAPVQRAGPSLSAGTGPSTAPAITIYYSVEIITVTCRGGELVLAERPPRVQRGVNEKLILG